MRGAIERSDLRVIAGDDQPRVLDIRLAERLGYERPRKIRDLIERNISELENYAPLPRLGAMVDRPQGGGRTSSEYWLTRSQARTICMWSNTATAVEVRAELNAVFDAWERGELKPAGEVPTITGAIRDLFDEMLLPALRDIKKDIKGIAGNVTVLAAKGRRDPSADTHRIHGIIIRHHYFCRCPCGECETRIMDEEGFVTLAWQYHHQFNRWDNRPEATIPLATACHQRITANAEARTRFDLTAWPQFQRLLARHPSRQLKFDF
jgi:hypothetical protein